MARNQNRKSGLTLIELLCVIGIIAILAALYLGVISKAFVKSKAAIHRIEKVGGYK
jgi:prepilin-type N-terminal cleavage/methylation domain-containing protein